MHVPRIQFFVLLAVSFMSVHIRTTEAFQFPHHKTEEGEEQLVTVKIQPVNTNATRQRRSDDLFPDELDIALSTDEIHQHFHHLRRNFDLSDEKPIHLMREGKVKKYRLNSKERVAHYSELDSGATFMVWPKSGEVDTTGEFDIFGTFISNNNQQYLIQPPTEKGSKYTMSKFTDDKLPAATDYVVAAPNTDERMMQEGEMKINRTSNTTLDRVKRQTLTAYEIEIFFVMDDAMYDIWYGYTEGQANRRETTLQYLYQLAAFLLNAINLRYETVTGKGYTITCIFAGIYVAENKTAAPFVNDHLFSFGFIANTVLTAFKIWAEENLDGLYDHAMLYSGYEMGSNKGGTFDAVTAGLAFLPTFNETSGILITPGVCGSSRYSINEGGTFKPTMATIGAHELGHNFNSKHDNSSLNACSADDGYVMAPSSGVSTDPSKNLRLWIFSTCSLNYFDQYVNALLVFYGEAVCLLNRAATNANQLDSYINDLPGQLYDPDAQCEKMVGPGSYLSRNFYDGDYSGICAQMLCAIPDSGSSRYAIPWEGTTCGNGKICQAGQCVTSDSGPQVSDEACLFGDVPYNVSGTSETCQQFLGTDATSYYCYANLNRNQCCATCEEIKQNNANNGEYTDCDYGDKWSDCASFTEDITQCRSETNQAICCKSCVDKRLDIPDCPWGDTYSNCAELSCSSFPAECCQTCAPSTTSTTTTTTPTTTTTTPTTTTTTTTTTTPTTTTTTPTTTTPTTTTTTPTTTTTTPTTTTTTPTTTTPTTTTTTTTTTTPTTTTTTPTTTTPTTTTTTPTTTTPTTTTTTPTTTTPTTTTTTPTTTTTTPTTTTTTPTTTTTTPTTTTTTPTTTTPTTTTTTSTTTTTTTTTTTPTTTTTTPTTTTTTPTTTTTTPTTTTTTPTTTTTTPTTTTTTPTTTTTTTTTTTPTTTTPLTTTPTTTTTTPTTTTTTPTTTTTTPTTTTSTSTTTPTTTTTTPTTTTTTPTTTTTTPTTTTTTPTTTTTTTPTTTTTTPTTTTPTTTTTTPTTTITTPTTTTTTPSTTTTTTTPTTTTTTPTTTATTPTTTTTTSTTTPTATTTTPTTTTTTPTTTTSTPTTTTPTTTTTTPTTTTSTPTTTATTPTTTTSTASTTTTITTLTTTTTTPTSTTTTPTTTTTTSTTTPTTTSTTPTPTTTTTTSPTTTSSLTSTTSKTKIFIFYRRTRRIRIRRIIVRGLRRGSLIVDYEVELEDDVESIADLTQANMDLVSGKESITLLNETVSATSIQIDNTTVTNENVNSSAKVCELFFLSYGNCDDNYACAVEEGRPVCVPEKTQYGLALVIAVTASVFVFLIVILIIICFSIRAFRRQKAKHSSDSLSTGTTDTEERHWPNESHIAPYGVLGGRQDRPVAYLPYSGEVIRESRNYRTHSKHREVKNSRFNQSRDSQEQRSSHRTSHRSDRDRKYLHNYGYDNRAMEYDQIMSASYTSNKGYERR